MNKRWPMAAAVLFFFIVIGLFGARDLPSTFAAAPQFVSPAPTATPTRSNQVSKGPTGNNVWTAIGPGGGWIRALAIDPGTPSTLYAGTWNSGVFKSTNGGTNWSASNNGLTSTTVTALVIDPVTPGTLYAGTWGGVFKSTNGGGSWSAFNSGLTALFVQALAIDPVSSSRLYAGTVGSGVFSINQVVYNYLPMILK